MHPGPTAAPLLALSLALASASARADATNAERDRADALFEEAKGLMAMSRFLEACPKLDEARRIDPTAGGTSLALALCHEGEGRAATALAELRDAQRMARASHNAERDALAAEHIDALAPHVSKIVLASPERARGVTVDGRAVPRESVVEVDGGEHVVRAEYDGAPPWEQRVSVASRDDVRVIEVPRGPSAREGAPPSTLASAASPQPSRGPRLRTAGLVVGVAGVAAALVGGYFGVRALGEQSDSRAVCPTNVCGDAQARASHADAQRDAVVADVGLGLGVAAIATGALLYFLDAGREPAATVAPAIGEHAAGFAVVGRF